MICGEMIIDAKNDNEIFEAATVASSIYFMGIICQYNILYILLIMLIYSVLFGL